MSNFIKDCLSGDALISDIDDYIDEWHEGDSKLELHDFLGMTKREYSLFLDDSDFLSFVVTAHKEKENVDEIVSRSVMHLAARSDDQRKAELLNKWLTRKNLW